MKRIFLFLALCLAMDIAVAQTGIYIPSAKPVKNMQLAMQEPEVFCLLVQYDANDSTYSIGDLDMMDSAYNVAFRYDNPKLYSMVIEGYGDANEALTQLRVDAIYNYFSQRCHSAFPIRYATNKIHCSCNGDTTELLRYEVPVDRRTYNCADLPESRRTFNKTIQLNNCVLVTFKNNPDECIGMARGCYVPNQDTTIHGYYASVHMRRGALQYVTNTKDTCPSATFSIEEHLDYKEILDRYSLVPNKKQIILQVGYVVLRSNMKRAYEECSQELADSIFVRFPVTQEQWDNKLRIFGKKYSEKGVEYKALATKKVAGKISINIQAGINVTQIDTLYLGKRIKEEEIGDYFFEVKNNIEQGVFTINGKHYKAYKIDKHGEWEIKKGLRSLLRIIEDQDEEIEEESKPSRARKAKNSDEEIE